MKKEYDLIFGVGQGCFVSSGLREANLQVRSYPFDWLYGTDFNGRTQILLSDFERYFEKDDLKFSHYEPTIDINAYKNSFHGIIFNHDFPTTQPFDEAYEEVSAKYKRRCERLLRQIKAAKSVLIVYAEWPLGENKLKDNAILLRQIDKFKAKYPRKTINLLYFTNDLNFAPLGYKEEQISADITKITGNYSGGGGANLTA